MNRSKNNLCTVGNISVSLGAPKTATSLPNMTNPEHHTQVVVVGKGSENFPFDNTKVLVQKVLKRADSQNRKGRRKSKTPSTVQERQRTGNKRFKNDNERVTNG